MAYTKEDQVGKKIKKNPEIDYRDFRDKHTDWRDLEDKCESYVDEFPDVARIRIPNNLLSYLMSEKTPIWIKKIVSNNLKGISDIVCIKDGRALCIELKSGKAKLREAQKKFLNRTGGYVVHDVPTFKEIFNKWYEFEV